MTAMRRAERLQDIPVSISALSGDALARQRIQQVTDLAGEVPNLQASPVGGDSLPVFSLRGVSMSDYSVNQQGPVATYFDEVYKGSFPLLGLSMYDLERVEVLRGPQGTLYGKNTTGGAINFISRKPEFHNEGNIRIGYGNYQRFDADGALQAALSDKVAARVAFTFSRADGWMKNLLPGGVDGNEVRQYGIRGSLRFVPSDKLDFVLRAATSLQNPHEYGVIAKPSGPNGIGDGIYEAFGQGTSYFRTGVGPREWEGTYTPRHRARTYSVSLNGDYHATDDLTVTSVTSYDKGELFWSEDADGSPRKVLDSDLPGRGWQFAQDLRVASSSRGPLNYILGAYYNIERLHSGSVYRYFYDLDVNGDGVVDFNDCLDPVSGYFLACEYSNSYTQTKKSAALYTDLKFALTERIALRGGLRYTRDEGDLTHFKALLFGVDGTPLANLIPGDPVDLDATTGRSFRKGTLTGKAGIDVKTESGNLLYVSFSRGYRANAFNAQAFLSPEELAVAAPETVNAYEFGFKSQLFERSVTLNTALFYYDYKNQQAINIDSTNFKQTLINIPKSRIYGGELEVTASPLEALRVNVSVGALSTKIRKGTISGVVLDGNRLPNAPNLNLSGGFDWDVLVTGNGKLTWSANGFYLSKQYFNLYNTERLAQGGYAVVNSELTYRFSNDRYSVAVWGKNVLDKYYARYTVDVSGTFGIDYYHIGDPRTFGISLQARF